MHGYPDDRHVWDRVAADLAADHHVVTYDVRGHSGSAAPGAPAGYDLELLAADLRTVADAVSPTLRCTCSRTTGARSRPGTP